jgi:hypothetical protein
MTNLQDFLLDEISKSNMRKLAIVATENQDLITKLWDFAISDEEPLNWRAAWAIKAIWEQNPSLIEPYIEPMIVALPRLKKDGVKREFLRMIQEYPLPENEEHLGILLDCCFLWLAAPAEPIAVKIHSMVILLQISKKIPEIKRELIHTIEVAMQEGSAGIVNRGRRTLIALQGKGGKMERV